MTQTTLQHYSVWVSEWKSRVSSWITMAALIDGNEYIGRRMLEWTSIVLFYAFCLSFRLSHGVIEWHDVELRDKAVYFMSAGLISSEICVCGRHVLILSWELKMSKNLEVFGLFLSNSDDVKFKINVEFEEEQLFFKEFLLPHNFSSYSTSHVNNSHKSITFKCQLKSSNSTDFHRLFT